MVGLKQFKKAVILICECLAHLFATERYVEVYHYVDNETYAVNIFVFYPKVEIDDVEARLLAGVSEPSPYFTKELSSELIVYVSNDMYSVFEKTAIYVKLPTQELISFFSSEICPLVFEQINRTLGETNEHSTG